MLVYEVFWVYNTGIKESAHALACCICECVEGAWYAFIEYDAYQSLREWRAANGGRMRGKMADIKFEIKEELGVLSESPKGWRKELNLVSWNGGAPKYDLREWAPEHEKMGKGVTLTKEEAQELGKLLSRI